MNPYSKCTLRVVGIHPLIGYPDSTNVSSSSVSGSFLTHSAAESRRTQKNFIVISLNVSINPAAELAVDLLRTTTSTARAILYNADVIKLCMPYYLLLSKLVIYLLPRPSCTSSFFCLSDSHCRNFSLLRSTISTFLSVFFAKIWFTPARCGN